LLDRICDKVKIGKEVAQGFYHQESKGRAKQLLERILNQNAQAEGMFYLHPDVAVKIVEPSVALLQVSVALRAREHYDTLVNARSGRLVEQFQSKLGWLIGNLFSRVATKDLRPSDRKELIARFLGSADDFPVDKPQWVPKKKIEVAQKAGLDISGMSRGEIAAALAQHRPTPAKEVAIDRVIVALQSTVESISEEQITAIRNNLAADAIFESVCR